MIVEFLPSGRGKAKCKSDKNYPDGKIINISTEEDIHRISIPYPAPECGVWILKCETCDFSVGVTAAGRPDDPKQINFKCRCQ